MFGFLRNGLRRLGENGIEIILEALERRADDVVDITPEIAGTDDLGALDNLDRGYGSEYQRRAQARAAAESQDVDIEQLLADTDAQSINIALRDNPIFQDPEVRLGVEQLRVGGSTNSEIREYLNGLEREYRKANSPVNAARDAVNIEQLRELYAEYKLPIPKTNAEERAANLIIDADQYPDDGAMLSILRKDIDLEYLKAHAPKDVFDKHGPTIFEAKLAEQQQGALSAILPISGPRPDIPFYSAAQRAAESLTVPSGSYKNLKKLMLKQKGVKAKELEWSGADEAFEGRTDVTPAELAEYLRQNTDLIEGMWWPYRKRDEGTSSGLDGYRERKRNNH